MRIRFQIKNKNNNQFFYVDENSIFTDNYNETLDSMSFHLSHTNELDIEPLDQVVVEYVITLNQQGHPIDWIEKRKYCVVESYVLHQDTLGIDSARYSYDISLCSETKLLEGIVLPNLSITPLRTGTKRSVWYYLSQYLELYGRKVRMEVEEDQYSFESLWSFDNSVREKFDSIDAPELQWNAPTLREVLNDLMLIGDCIVKLENNVIGYIDLTETKKEITNFNFIQKSQSIEDYVSEVKMNMQNVLQTQIDGIKNTITTSEMLTFTSDEFVIKSDNIYLKTAFPILNIKKFSVCVFTGDDYESYPDVYIEEIDMTNYVKEYQEFITLPILYSTASLPSGANPYDYATYCVYYNRGSNKIDGFVNLTKFISFLPIQDQTWSLLKGLAKQKGQGHITLDGAYNSHLSVFFKIEYETMADQVFSASKEDATNKKVVVDNQTNSWVDAYNQGNMEYQKANRLGNQKVMFNQRINIQNSVGALNSAIEIGDFYKDGDDTIVIYQVQYQIFTDHLEVNAFGTKDYILRDYFTGINSKIRTWVNAKDEALIRHELEKYYCRVSLVQHEEVEAYSTNIAKMIGYSIFFEGDDKAHPIQYGAIQTYDGENYIPSGTNKYQCECVSRIMGKSFVFTTGFNDNYEAGQRNASLTISDIRSAILDEVNNVEHIREPYIMSSTTSEFGGLKTQPVKYVDSKGEFEKLNLTLFNRCSDVPTSDTPLANNNDEQEQFFVDMYKRPIMDESAIDKEEYTMSKDFYKDNKEIFKISIQFEVLNSRKEQDIYTTKYFLKYNPIIMDEGAELLSQYFKVGDYKYELENVDGYVDVSSGSEVVYLEDESTYETAKYRVIFDTEYLNEKGLFITDEDGNVLVGFNMNQAKTTTINGVEKAYIDFYINVLKDLDLGIYDYDGYKIEEI